MQAMANFQQERQKSIQDGELSNNARLTYASNVFSGTSSFLEFVDGELREDEERDMAVLKVREIIISDLVEELYRRYIDRQVIPFAVRIFERSLTKLLNWYFLPKDNEDTPEDWEEDEPPSPVPLDNWASGCVPPGVYPPPVKFNFSSPATHDEETPQMQNFEEPTETIAGIDNISQTVIGSKIKRSASDPGPICYENLSLMPVDTADSSISVAGVSAISKGTKSEGSRQTRKTRFVTPSDRNFKLKREIYQWINPKNFLAVRVVPEIYHVPGEKFSGKTCGRKGLNKSITIRNNKPTLIPTEGKETRRKCSV